jgi:hypothetical protein
MGRFTGTPGTMAISVFSTTSLADISNISVYSLPICIQEVRDLYSYTEVQVPAARSLPRTGVTQLFKNILREGTFKGEDPCPEPIPLKPSPRVPAENRVSSNRPPARHGFPKDYWDLREDRPPPIYEDDEFESNDIVQCITTLCLIIDGHAKKFFKGDVTGYIRLAISKTVLKNILSGNDSGITPRVSPKSPLSKPSNSVYHVNGYM